MSQPSGKRVALEIASAFEALTLVDHVSEDFARLAGLDEDGCHWFGVAVREATVNAIKHGNAGDRGKRVHIEYDIANDGSKPHVMVRVRDEGSGFDPAQLPDPCALERAEATNGRGVFLMRTFMDDVQVRRAPTGGTEVVMQKTVGPQFRTT